MNYTDNELQQERWKDIDGYDGMYQVSSLGRVMSLKFGKTRVLRPGKNTNGYLFVNLWKDGKQKHCRVHRLVAQAFIPNDDSSKSQINHRNEDKTENSVSNLEWCTASYNLSYNGLRYRSKRPQHYNCIRRKIKPLYNPELTINENLEIFKSNGIECCRDTVIQLRKDLGLSRPRKYTKPN